MKKYVKADIIDAHNEAKDDMRDCLYDASDAVNQIWLNVSKCFNEHMGFDDMFNVGKEALKSLEKCQDELNNLIIALNKKEYN